MKAKYGSDYEEDDISESDSESDESEDEDGEELTPAVDAAILRTLARIRQRDPRIYDGARAVFDGAWPALAHTPSSSKKRSLKDEKPLPPLASTLDVVQFDPGNVLHNEKAPRLFLSLQRHFADPALASKADVYMFADECIFVGAVVHDALAWSREGGQPCGRC